jgi:asparagine synthetase B (glutamine-hydrolysing)
MFTKELKKRFYQPEFKKQIGDYDPLEPYVKLMRKAESAGCSDLDCCLYADLKFYLPNDMLVKVDRMSMAHGLEVRVPFLDTEIVDFCWRLPDSLKIRNGRGKYILRQIINDQYPDSLKSRPKSGFNMEPNPDFIPDLVPTRFHHVDGVNTQVFFSKYSAFCGKYLLYVLQCKEQ